MPRAWIAVASAEHVRLGRQGGFMQTCHGKGGPLRRLRPGDDIVYYSPTVVFGARDGLRAFTALGQVRDDRVYQADMGGGFVPFRRDVDWRTADEAPILPLLDQLDLTRGKRNWGYAFRFGLVAISPADFLVIERAMTVV